MARRPARGRAGAARRTGIGMVVLAGGTAAPSLPTITVTTPASQAADAPYSVTVSGTYGNGGAGAVQVSISNDSGASWSAWATLAGSPTGGAYSGSVAFAAGGPACRVRVRQASHAGVIAVSADFALLPAPIVSDRGLADTTGELLTDTTGEPLEEAI